MARVSIDEIEEVYRRYGIPIDEKKLMRTTLNEGNLRKRLNTNCVTSLKNEISKVHSSEDGN